MAEDLFALVELGSNSFHFLAVRKRSNQLENVEHLVETVQVSRQISNDGVLSEPGAARVLEIADGFAARLEALRPARTAVIATAWIRQLASASDMMEGLKNRLGQPVRVLTGAEEAILAYIGAHATGSIGDEDCLLVDIGGASSQLVRGHGHHVAWSNSIPMGCVTVTEEFFPAGGCNAAQMNDAITALQARWADAIATMPSKPSSAVLHGAGGTVSGVMLVSQVNRLCATKLTGASLDRLIHALANDGGPQKLGRDIITAERQRVFCAGTALIAALFKATGIERMVAAKGGLREGVLVQLIRSSQLNG